MKSLICFLWLYVTMATGQTQHFPTLPLAQERIRAGVLVPTGAICENRVPGYFVMEGRQLLTGNDLKFDRLSEKECSDMCTDNRDTKGRPILCAAFSYNPVTRMCLVHRAQTAPGGNMPLQDAPGQRYFEKFCLPRSAPIGCGESLFYREQQAIIVGFARNVSVETSLEDCVAACVRDSLCESAMYFYEEGECITNSASAQKQPQVFVEEPTDKVVYFENGCLSQRQNQGQAQAAVLKQDTQEKHDSSIVQAIRSEVLSKEVDYENFGSSAVTKKPTEAAATPAAKVATAAPPPKATAAAKLPSGTGRFSRWSDWSLCDRPNGRRVRTRHCLDINGGCTGALMESQWCDGVDPSLVATRPPPTVAPVVRIVAPQDAAPVSIPPQIGPTADFSKAENWGPWEEECHLFNQDQSCKDGKKVGFQTRNCNGFRFQCSGNIFRYCFIPC